MAAGSNTYYLQKYEDAFTKQGNIDALVRLFNNSTTLFNARDLAGIKVVTLEEWREIEQKSKVRVSQRRVKQSRLLIEKVMNKNSLEAYRGFRAYAKIQAEKSGLMKELNRVFPFGEEEDRAGLAPRLVPKTNVVAPDSSQVPSKSDKPTILWATSNKTEFDVVKYSLGKDCNVKANRESAQYEFMIEEMTVHLSEEESAMLFLAYPKTELTGPNPFQQLLNNFDPRPHLAVMTGVCLPLPESTLVNPSDVVVVTCTEPLPIEGEVQYLTELWSLNGRLEKIFSGHKPNVLFGRATNTMGQGKTDYIVHCPRAMQFYAAAKNIDGLVFLAVMQVEAADMAGSKVNTNKSTTQYVHDIIVSIIEVL